MSQIRLNAMNAKVVYDRAEKLEDSLSFYFFFFHSPFSPKGLDWDYRKERVKTKYKQEADQAYSVRPVSSCYQNQTMVSQK